MAKTIGKVQNLKEPPQSSGLIPLLVFCVLSLYVGSLIYNYGYSSYDDGAAAEGARLVLQGKVPYRDFWTMYSPGASYLNALAMAVLGENMVSLRVFGLLGGILQAVLLYSIIRRTVRNTAAGVACAAVYIALIPIGIVAFWFTAVLAVVYCLVRYLESPSNKWCYLSGLFIGVTSLLRQDTGAYLALAVFPLIYVASPGKGARRFVPALRAAAVFAAVIAGVVVFFAANRALPQLWECTVRFPVVDFPSSRPLPYPLPWNDVLVIGPYSASLSIGFLYQLFGFYLLPAIILAATVLATCSMIRDGDRSKLIAVALLVVALALYMMVRVRPSGARIVAGVTLSMIAFASLVPDTSKKARTAVVGIFVVALAAFVPFGAYSVWAQRSYAGSVIPGSGGLYAARGHAETLAAVSEYVRKNTRPSEKILSGSPAVYFLASRDPATVFFEPHPLVTDRHDTQQTIIRNMEKERVRFFVRSREWGGESYFTVEAEHQPRELIAYIEANYRQREDFYIFQVYERVTLFAGK